MFNLAGMYSFHSIPIFILSSHLIILQNSENDLKPFTLVLHFNFRMAETLGAIASAVAVCEGLIVIVPIIKKKCASSKWICKQLEKLEREVKPIHNQLRNYEAKAKLSGKLLFGQLNQSQINLISSLKSRYILIESYLKSLSRDETPPIESPKKEKNKKKKTSRPPGSKDAGQSKTKAKRVAAKT